jgi:hypothetical protein
MLTTLTIYGFIAVTALGVLAFLGLAFRGYLRDTLRTVTPDAVENRGRVIPMRKAA